jgi:hypothetical protein
MQRRKLNIDQVAPRVIGGYSEVWARKKIQLGINYHASY